MQDATDVDHALTDPITFFEGPGDVVYDAKLSFEQKHKILQQWAFAAYCADMSLTDPFRCEMTMTLDEIIDALIDLDDAEPAKRRPDRMR